MLKLTADQIKKFDPVAAGWTAGVLIRYAEFPEVKDREIVYQRDAYTRDSERLVIEWDRGWEIRALARNGHWVQGNLTWEVLQHLVRDCYPNVNVKVTDAPGYADFHAELLLDSEMWPVVVVGFDLNGERNVAVVPRSCVSRLEEE